ncbi:MAG TPA: tripartite tricarboxylate transporter substrate binding protein [Xanthobacteraceae bacterium]|nr:tripartite tricarboxylate transporter substrate binding protein [Xanthobacteraceae bacterium]
MESLITRRNSLELLAGGISCAALCARSAFAAVDDYPAKPITLVNPNPPAGYTDNLGRVIAPFLSRALGKPVTVTNIPGASEMLGLEYFLKQPDDGYFILVVAPSFIPVNILLQHAPFKVTDFSMVNLPARDFTLLATSKGGDLKSVNDLLAALKKDPQRLSVGVPRASTDYINLILLMRAAGVDPAKLRLVTYESGGQVRSAVIGAVVDCGFAGGEGFLPLVDQIRPLLTFAATRQAPFDAPAVPEVNLGATFEPVAGSLRGFAVGSSFKDKYPDRYNKLVDAYKTVFADPKVVASLKNQDLASTWYGPEDSEAVYLKTCKQIQNHADLLNGS